MYPFVNEAMRKPAPNTDSDRFVARVVGRELSLSSHIRLNSKDPAASKLRGIKSDKAADFDKENQIRYLRKQLTVLPEPIRELARTSWNYEQDQKRKNLQDFQCMLICHLHKIIMKQFIATGLDPKMYRMGGNDRRTYGTNPSPSHLLEHFYYLLITCRPPIPFVRTFLPSRTLHADDEATVHHRHASLLRRRHLEDGIVLREAI